MLPCMHIRFTSIYAAPEGRSYTVITFIALHSIISGCYPCNTSIVKTKSDAHA